MKALILLPALALAGATIAQTPPASSTRAAPSAVRKFPGVSDAGNAILSKAMSTPDPEMVTAIRALRANRDSLQHLVMSPPIDPDKLAALLKEGEAAQATMRERQDTLMVAAIRQLNDADRAAYLRTLMTPAPGAAVR